MSQPVSSYPPPGQYAQPQQPQQPYGQPVHAPQQPAYGAPQQPAYGAPQQYAQPQYPQYGQPQPGTPYPQQPYAQPQQQYAQPQYAPAQPAPVSHPGAASSAELECRMCGSVPAAKATFRGHQGMILIMRFLSLKGPFCRDCGLATYRSMTARTLVQGWWGYISFIVTPLTVLYNFIPRQKVAGLAPPRPAAHGNSRRPMDPGSALLARPMALIGLAIPVALFVVIVLALALGGS